MTGRTPTRTSATRRWGLASRLLAGQILVLLIGALTAGAVALVVGPSIFHDHLLQAGHREGSPELLHTEMAYRDASLISVGGALLISLLAAAAVSWVLTRRLRRPLDEISLAAQQLALGRYDARVPVLAAGTELETLAATFNTMAARLEGVESARRRMLSDLAHELRTPIAALGAYHDGLHDGVVTLGAGSRSALTEQTDRLARLAEDIEEVSTAEEGRLGLVLVDVPLADILRSAEGSFAGPFEDLGVALRVEVDTEADLRVRADPDRVGQVLTNLLSNALRHTPPGGTVRVSGARDGADVSLTVSDTGDGMTREQLEHAFERFYRGDSARTRDRRGSGIGLTISRAIVQAHGGAIVARSDGPGRGSTFVITLPASDRLLRS